MRRTAVLPPGDLQTFQYPEDLKAAQRQLVAVRAERSAYLAALPAWGGDLEAAARGLSEEHRAEARRLEEAEQAAAHTVWAHPYWRDRKQLPLGDVVDARSGLNHIDDHQPQAAVA